MSRNWYPVINYENYIECGACIEKCSHGVYKKEEKKPVVIFPEGCIQGCKGCQGVCPADAIEYVGDIGGSNSCGCGGCGCS